MKGVNYKITLERSKALERISELYRFKELVDKVTDVSDNILEVWVKEIAVFSDVDLTELDRNLKNFRKRLEKIRKKVFMDEYWKRRFEK